MINKDRYEELFSRASSGEPLPDGLTEEEIEIYKSFKYNDIEKLKRVFALLEVNLCETSKNKVNNSKEIKVYYRISNLEASISKNKIPNATKKNCLNNCIKEFGIENITLIADKVNNETYEYLKSLKLKIIKVYNGSGAGTFRDALNLAIKENEDNDYVYLLEDDFLHLPGSSKLLKEGI